MIQSEALEEVAVIAAFWPGTPPETIAAYATELLGEELADLQVARHSIVGSWTKDRLPPVAFVREHVRAARRDRLVQAQAALPGHAVAAAPIDEPTGKFIGRRELGLRARRLRVGLLQLGLRGQELLDYTLNQQDCDTAPPPDPEDELRRQAAVLAGEEVAPVD